MLKKIFKKYFKI